MLLGCIGCYSIHGMYWNVGRKRKNDATEIVDIRDGAACFGV